MFKCVFVKVTKHMERERVLATVQFKLSLVGDICRLFTENDWIYRANKMLTPANLNICTILRCVEYIVKCYVDNTVAVLCRSQSIIHSENEKKKLVMCRCHTTFKSSDNIYNINLSHWQNMCKYFSFTSFAPGTKNLNVFL